MTGVLKSLEAGNNFSQSLARYPNIFSNLLVNMVKVGEASGRLEAVLKRFVEFSEHQIDLRQKIKGALFYPAILLTAGIMVFLFTVTFIIPKFVEIFMKSGIMLPMPTLVLYKIGSCVKHFWYVGVFLIIAVYSGWKYYISTENGRFNFDRLKLNLPIFGALYRKVAISDFAKTLATLISSGVPILQSVDITREVIGNEVVKRVILSVRSSVEKGGMISEALRISEEFPSDAVQMILVGEETGNLDRMLNKIADFYDRSLGYTIRKLTIILEPSLLVIMGAMTGFIMASMLLPVFDMMKLLRR